MSLKYILFIISMCMVSCTYFFKPKVYRPCHFNRNDLTVIGSDFDFEHEIIYTDALVWWLIPRLSVGNPQIYRPETNSNYLHSASFKISFCNDTTWAKQQIFNELKIKYPFIIKDTIESYRVYDIHLADSTKLISTNLIEGEYDYGSEDNHYYSKNISLDYMMDEVVSLVCGVIGNETFRCEVTEKSYLHHFKGRYDFKFRKEYFYTYSKHKNLKQKSFEETIQYALDSLGFKIELDKEFTKPIKIIKFLD